MSDILDNIANIERYIGSLTETAFRADGKTRDAVERCLQRIAEAATKLGDDASAMMPNQPWPNIRGLGNRLRHAYDRIGAAEIWQIAKIDLPSLRRDCEAARERLAKR